MKRKWPWITWWLLAHALAFWVSCHGGEQPPEASVVVLDASIADAEVRWEDAGTVVTVEAPAAKARDAGHHFGSDYQYVLPPGPVGYIPQSVGPGQAAPWVPFPGLGDAGLTTNLSPQVTGPSNANVVVQIHGATVPIAGALTTGNALQVSGASALTYAAINLAGGTGSVTGALPITNLAHGTTDQVLFTNLAGTANTWATITGDSTAAGTPGVWTNTGMRGQSVAAGTTSGQVWQYNGTSWVVVAGSSLGGGVTWANDLAGSSGTHQWLASISGPGGAGGTVPITASALEFQQTSSIFTTTGTLLIDGPGVMEFGAGTATTLLLGNSSSTSIVRWTVISAGVYDWLAGTSQLVRFAEQTGSGTIWINNPSSPITYNSTNYALVFDSTNLSVNAPTGGAVMLGVGGTYAVSIGLGAIGVSAGLGGHLAPMVLQTDGTPGSIGNVVVTPAAAVVITASQSQNPIICLQTTAGNPLSVAGVVQVADTPGYYIFDFTSVVLSTGGLRFRAGASGSLTAAITSPPTGVTLVTVVTYGGGLISMMY
jgi:hypothetical protein